MMTFLDHLLELRSKLLLCFFAVALGAGIAHWFHEEIIALLLRPLEGETLVFTSPLDPLLFILKVDVSAGIVLSLPVIGWSVLSFLKPAMQRSRWLMISALYCVAALLVLAGIAYAYFVMVPLTLGMLTAIRIPGIGNMFTANSYIHFLLLQSLLMTALFQMPLVILAGSAIGAWSARSLASRRRYIYAAGLIALAVITPTTDLLSLGLVALPACVIFEGSLAAAHVLERFQSRRAAATARSSL